MNSVKIKKGRRSPKSAPGGHGADTAQSRPAGRGGRGRRTTYHHGDLRQRLLEVTEEIILEQGISGFSLREAARRAGVSPAAPAHHFKDARGLLTAVATLGFREFGASLEKADAAGGKDPARRLHEQGLAYVRFALEQPARFQLMFRPEKLGTDDAELASASRHAYEVLEGAIRAAIGLPAKQPLTNTAYGFLLAIWSVVHGFAHLALGGALRDTAGNRAQPATILQELLPLMLQHLPVP